VIPEDQEIPLGGVPFDGPRKKILQDLRVDGIRFAECLHTSRLYPPPFVIRKRRVFLSSRRSSWTRTLTSFVEPAWAISSMSRRAAPSKIVVPGHIDHDRPFCLAITMNLCLVHHHAPFYPVISGLNFRADGKGYGWEKSKKVGTYRRYRQRICILGQGSDDFRYRLMGNSLCMKGPYMSSYSGIRK